MSEVHVFQGDATSRSQDVTGYPVGEKHALIVFLKQPEGSDHDWAAAEANNLDGLISALANKGQLSGTKAKRARASAHIRTKATHAQWEEFELDDVKAAVEFTRELIRSKLET